MIQILDTKIIEELRRLRNLGKPPSELLNYIKQQFPEDTHIVFSCMKYFRKAFDLSIKQVSPIAGWHSGEISDQRVDAFLNDEMIGSKHTAPNKI